MLLRLLFQFECEIGANKFDAYKANDKSNCKAFELAKLTVKAYYNCIPIQIYYWRLFHGIVFVFHTPMNLICAVFKFAICHKLQPYAILKGQSSAIIAFHHMTWNGMVLIVNGQQTAVKKNQPTALIVFLSFMPVI